MRGEAERRNLLTIKLSRLDEFARENLGAGILGGGGVEPVTERLSRSQRRNDYPAPAYLPPSVDWTERGKHSCDLSEDISHSQYPRQVW